MAYFQKLKLDPNFEQWLDQKILKLKAEGVLQSDAEETEEEGERKFISARGEEEEEFVWGEEPVEYSTEYIDASGRLTSDFHSESMAGSSNVNDSDLNTDQESITNYRLHMSPEAGREYYQFTWEDDDEADVFDRQVYLPKNGRPPTTTPQYQFTEYRDDPASKTGQYGDSQRGVGRDATGKIYSFEGNNTGKSSTRLGQLGGLVLGIGQKDMDVSYTKMRTTNKGNSINVKETKSGSKYLDHDPDLPDPRFSISDDFEPSFGVPMQEIKRKGQTEDQVGVRVHEDGDNATRQAGKSHLSNGSTRRSKNPNRILLPLDTLEMSMSSEDEDVGVVDDIDDADSELAPDTQPIVTVDQATLVQQWRAKSKRSKIAIVVGIGGTAALIFGTVVIIMVEILKGSW